MSQQKQQPAQQPQAPQQSTSTHSFAIKKEKDSTQPPPPKRPQMAPQLAESLRSLSPAIEITPLVTFEVSPNEIQIFTSRSKFLQFGFKAIFLFCRKLKRNQLIQKTTAMTKDPWEAIKTTPWIKYAHSYN